MVNFYQKKRPEDSLPAISPDKNFVGFMDVFSILCFTVIIFAIYSSNLDGPFIFDDSRIQNNPQIHMTSLSVDNLIKAGFESSPKTRPLAHISFALNYYFHGFDTKGYHLVNIVIHALTAIFLYLFVKTTLNLPLFQARHMHYTLLPFAAALIWAVHPLQTQSVTYIIQRMNSMAAMFYLLSLYLYARARLTQGTGRKWFLFSGAILAGIFALASKETSATLPFFIFLYEWYFFQDLDAKWLKRQILPICFLLVGLVLISLLYLGSNPLETILATYGSRDFTPMQRILTESRVVMFYLSLLVLPLPSRLNLDHDFILSSGIASPLTTLVSAGSLLLLVLIAIYSARKHRLISFCILWFLGNLVIESSVIGLEIIFEHRNYLPSMMVVLLALVLIFPILKRSTLKVVFLGFIVLLLSFWTFERNSVWNDRISLWGDCVAKSPEKARPHNNLGVALKDTGRIDEAIEHFRKTIDLDPEFTEAYNNLGNSHIQLGRFKEAIKNYKMALSISPENPRVHANLGNVLVKLWQLEEALLHYSEAMRLNPSDLETQMNLRSVEQMIYAKKSRDRQTGK